MKKSMITLFALTAFILAVFSACGSGESSFLTPEEVQEIALEDAGLSADDVADIHTHAAANQKAPSYSVHITVGGTEYEYIIDAKTGEILYADDIG